MIDRAVQVLVLAAVAIIALVNWLRDRLLFVPRRAMEAPPDDPHDDIYLTPDGRWTTQRPSMGDFVNCWHFRQRPGRPVILHAHGTTGNISHRDYMIELGKLLDVNIFLFDYRGYGRSSNGTSPAVVYQDASLAYHHLLHYYRPDQIYLWGESLGGASAIFVAGHYECAGLILLGTFSSLDAVLLMRCGLRDRIMGFIAQTVIDNMPSVEHIRGARCPVVILHSTTDAVIPFVCAQILYEAVNHSRKMLIPIRGAHATPLITVGELRAACAAVGLSTNMASDSAIEAWLTLINTSVYRNRLSAPEITMGEKEPIYCGRP